MRKERIYIGSARSRNKNLNMTCPDWMNEWTNEQTREWAGAGTNERANEQTNERMKWTNLQAILKWNKHNCQNIVTGQTYPGLRHPWIIFARHWAKIVVLFTSFSGKWFTSAVTSAVAAQFSHENIYLDLTLPPKRVNGNASRRLCSTLREN